MNKVMSFIKLDFVTIKPYVTLKNLIIFIAVAVIMIISSDMSASGIGVLMIFAGLYVTYPFAIGEKSSIDSLYITLSIKRSTVVLGRYLFAFVVDVCSGLLAYFFTFVIFIVLQKEFDAIESLLVLVVVFFIYSIIQAIQLPIFFKLGYTKAKFLGYIPFLGIPVIVVLFGNFFQNIALSEKIVSFLKWFEANPLAVVLFGVVFWIVIMALSYQASFAYYNKRDF
jgi:hypothetical protein